MLIREIVDRASAAGLPVTLRLEGNSTSVRGTVAHPAFRVVQEGPTNALRYASTRPARARHCRDLRLALWRGAEPRFQSLGARGGRRCLRDDRVESPT